MLETPSIPRYYGGEPVRLAPYSDNVSGADNQQERRFIEAIPSTLGAFLSGFAMGEASFMLVCRPRGDYQRRWKISPAFNVSRKDPEPLELFMRTGRMSETDLRHVLSLREDMNCGGKRCYTMERILRDYTPSSPVQR